MEGEGSIQVGPMAAQYQYDRDRLEYELTVRQEPKQARMCGVGGKADRRPIDPPPIIQLRVLDPAASSARRRSGKSSPDTPSSDSSPSNITNVGYAQNFLQNPYYFMFASLAKPDDDAELHWLKDGRTRCTTGSVVSSLYHLKDTEHHNEDAGFFVFPDLSVRTEGSYRLKLSLYEVVGNNVHHCKSIYSAPFYVYTAKKFPGMEESTPLSCSLADQGIKIRIRKDIRVRKRPIHALEHPLPQPQDESTAEHEDDGNSTGMDDETRRSRKRDSKRGRFDDHTEHTTNDSTNKPAQLQSTWPQSPTGMVGPGVNESSATTSDGPQVIPPPPPPGSEQPNIVQGLPGPSVYDGRGGGYQPYESSQQQSSHAQSYRSPNETPTTQPAPAPVQHPQTYPPPPTQQAHTPTQQYGPSATQHVPPPSQHIPPPPPPQPQHIHPPPQHTAPPPQSQHMPPPPPPSHIPPAHHLPPSSHSHHSAPPPPPSTQQGYSPYPSSGWNIPPPQQTPIYDPYGHHLQAPPPHHTHQQTHVQHPQHVQHLHQHSQHYGHPHPHMHHGPPPPPSRYEYPASMYAHPPPQQQAYAGYYEQQPPPPGYGTSSPGIAQSSSVPGGPQQQAPGPTQGPSSAVTSGYTEYSYSRGSPIPAPRVYAHPPHPYGHPPAGVPGPPTGSYPASPARYPPPHTSNFHYGYAAPPPPPPQADSWGPGQHQGHQGYQTWSTAEAYGPGNVGGGPPLAGPGSSGLVSTMGDRIQLAPLRATHGNASPPHIPPPSLSGHGSSSRYQPPVVRMRSNSREDVYVPRDDPMERPKERGLPGDGDRGGKKNPLSIGSIISEETG